ncbi:MAG: hypothetical protein M3342_08680 [Bacteroidota bacterium]|nr:hypothetical protein [Flavisolibacter sp.]MDQ3844072.1 hypothetical protein [Bacteroidota bacterium]
MPTRFVCLANSFKEGGRCLAGIELDQQNKPVMMNGRPKWIRPICNTPHCEVPTHLVAHLRMLDIIEIEVTGNPNTDYQCENALFRESSIRRIGKFEKENLKALCENPFTIFNNRGNAVSRDAIKSLNHSLLLIHTDHFAIAERTYEDTKKKQTRLVFTHRGNQYNFPITDPVFLRFYQADPEFMEGINQLFLCLSLGVAWQDWYYKLVAGIIIDNIPAAQKNTQPIDDLPF